MLNKMFKQVTSVMKTVWSKIKKIVGYSIGIPPAIVVRIKNRLERHLLERKVIKALRECAEYESIMRLVLIHRGR